MNQMIIRTFAVFAIDTPGPGGTGARCNVGSTKGAERQGDQSTPAIVGQACIDGSAVLTVVAR